MKNSEINFKVTLDDQNIPEKITWDATDKPEDVDGNTNAIAISVWDNGTRNTLRMDLWSKDMTTLDMKRFCVDSIGGLASTIESATGDQEMSEEMYALCRKLVKHIEKETKGN